VKEKYKSEDLFVLLVHHMIDLLLFKEKVELLNHIFSLNFIEEKSIEHTIKDYFDMQIIHAKKITGIILFVKENKKTKPKVLILKNNKWVESEPLDEKEIIEEGKKKKVNLNSIVGFIELDNKDRFLVFKVKELNFKRNTGARCDEAAKSKKISILNEIVGYNKYVDKIIVSEEELTVLKKEKNLSEQEIDKKYIVSEDRVLVSTKGIVQEELCSLQELIFRYNSKIKKDGKTWFLNYEMSNLFL
jgi:hypothetical protein